MKNKLKKLVELSYINEKLDPEVVDSIASRLSRQELKQYITLLKQKENEKQIFVTSAKALDNKSQEKMQKLFPNKKVNYAVDASMISGIKVIENDTEFEINLDRTFHDIMVFLSKND